jgi:hypothetical protein
MDTCASGKIAVPCCCYLLRLLVNNQENDVGLKGCASGK